MQADSLEEPFKFNPTSTIVSAQADSLERQTRHEISQIVAEISELSRSNLPAGSFWQQFAAGLLRALAAESLVIWSVVPGNNPQAIIRVGGRSDVDLSAIQQPKHLELISDIAQNGRPVLVPPSVDDESDGISNPLPEWVAIVPLESGDRATIAIEALLSEVGGPSAQRGYLKFIAQMADFATEYLRTSSLNNLKLQRNLWEHWERSLERINRATNVADVQRRLVDGAAECLALPRVSLLERARIGWQLVASNGIDAPDPRGAAGLWLAKLAGECAANQYREIATAIKKQCGDTNDNPTNLRVLTIIPIAWPNDDAQGMSQIHQASVPETKSFQDISPVAALIYQADSEHLWDADQQSIAEAIARSASGAMRATELAAALPWVGGWLLKRGRQHQWQRSFFMLAIVAVMILGIGLIPIPLRVIAPATLESKSVAVVQAPRDGIIQTLLVRHDQSVTEKTPLLEMIDPELDRLEEQWLGQQSVLSKRNSELQRNLIRGDDPSRRTQWEAEQAEVAAELSAVARQLTWLRDQRQSLTITSPRSGQVEGWDLEQKLSGRQVQRGESLLRVFDPNGNWRIRAEIPQTRLDHVLHALADNESLSVSIVLRSFPEQPLSGTLRSLGPTTAVGQNGLPVGWTDIEVAGDALPIKQSGAAATVAISCGNRCLGYVLFQDIIRAATGWWKLWTA